MRLCNPGAGAPENSQSSGPPASRERIARQGGRNQIGE